MFFNTIWFYVGFPFIKSRFSFSDDFQGTWYKKTQGSWCCFFSIVTLTCKIEPSDQNHVHLKDLRVENLVKWAKNEKNIGSVKYIYNKKRRTHLLCVCVSLLKSPIVYVINSDFLCQLGIGKIFSLHRRDTVQYVAIYLKFFLQHFVFKLFSFSWFEIIFLRWVR